MDFDGWKNGRFLTFQTSNNSKVQSVSIEPRHSCRKDAMSASAIWGCLIRGTFRRGSQISGATKQVGITSNCVNFKPSSLHNHWMQSKKSSTQIQIYPWRCSVTSLGDWLHHLDCLLGVFRASRAQLRDAIWESISLGIEYGKIGTYENGQENNDNYIVFYSQIKEYQIFSIITKPLLWSLLSLLLSSSIQKVCTYAHAQRKPRSNWSKWWAWQSWNPRIMFISTTTKRGMRSEVPHESLQKMDIPCTPQKFNIGPTTGRIQSP